jgi:hypothetical protein
MPLPAPLRRFKDWTRHWRHRGLLAPLQQANATSRAPVVGDAPVAVSLTSYGMRLDSVHLTVESIAAGRVRPRRLMLWLDDPAAHAAPPDTLRRLMDRGLELRLCDWMGPHAKYFGHVRDDVPDGGGTQPLVTADDDMLYGPDWLDTLLAAHAARPAEVHAWRARVMRLAADGSPAPYRDWPLCASADASPWHFATGVAGVIYPPRLLGALRAAGDGFRAVCPRADDVWLHAQALRAGVPVRQVQAQARSWPCIPGTEAVGLMHGNIAGAGNDAQIRATYTPDDLRRLATAPTPT